MTKFTSGEWLISGVGDMTYIDSESGFTIATVLDMRPELANAHLIASAPDMYNKLKDMAELLTMLDPHTHANIELDCVVYEINELLTKARGEQ